MGPIKFEVPTTCRWRLYQSVLLATEKRKQLWQIQADKEITKGYLAIHRISRTAREPRLAPLYPGASTNSFWTQSSEEPLLIPLETHPVAHSSDSGLCFQHRAAAPRTRVWLPLPSQENGFCTGPASDRLGHTL